MDVPQPTQTTLKSAKNDQIESLRLIFPPRYKNLKPNFDTFARMKDNSESFIVTGKVGTGKTRMLLEVMMAYMLDRLYGRFPDDDPVRLDPKIMTKYFLNVSDVLRQIKDSFDTRDPDSIMDRMIKTDILFLDDLGAEKASDWVKEQLYIVINERYNWMRPVFITTNLSYEEIAQNYNDRFASRLVEMCIKIEMNGRDYRLEKVRGGDNS